MTPEVPDEYLVPPMEPATSHDPQDMLMGNVVSTDPEDYGLSTHVLIGCPQDLGVRRNAGRSGAAEAPDSIRRFFYKLKPPVPTSGVRVLDLGNIAVHESLREMHNRLRATVRQALWDGKVVMVLGGGNDISFPDAHAVSEVCPGFAAVNVDAHLDMRKSDVVHSGTPYRNLIENGCLDPSSLHEIGVQPWANSANYLSDAEEMGVNVHTLHHMQGIGTDRFLEDLFKTLEGRTLFAGLDMDSVRASDAPGVSAPCSVGLSAEDVLDFAARCRGHGETAVFEITEVNPGVDVDDRTSRLAALTLYTFIYGRR